MGTTLIIAIVTMGGLALIFAAFLAIADKKLRVEENPLIGKVNDALPGANCGACGKAGCYDFAVNVVDGTAEVNGCPVGGSETAHALAEIMGVEAGSSVKMIPRIMCKGGNQTANDKLVEYYGPMTCAAMDVVSGGTKQCFYGCLGGGDCVVACPFDAMVMNNETGLPEVIEDLCTSCEMCVKACPRDIIEMHPQDRNVFVFCNNHDDPKKAREVCDVACTSCAACARNTNGAIQMINNLAVIDYSRIDESTIAFDKCKSGAICQLVEPAADDVIEKLRAKNIEISNV